MKLRRRYITKPAFQLRYVGIIIITVFAVALICIFTTHFTAMSLLGQKLSYVYPYGRLVSTLREVNLTVTYRVLLLIPLIALIGIFLSHRIAGPAYRIERVLREIGKGNFDVYIRLRKYDELKGIADAINDMVSDLKKSMKR